MSDGRLRGLVGVGCGGTKEGGEMAYSIEKVDVWSGPIKDKPGGLTETLNTVTDAGANLQFLLARRAERGAAVIFMAPVKGAGQARAAKKAGLSKSAGLVALRVEGPDKKGLGAAMSKALAEAGINLRGFSATAIGRKCVVYIAFDSARDANKGRQVLKKALAG